MRFILAFWVMLMITAANSFSERNFKLFDTKTKQEVNISELAEKALKSDVIFFGEFHDDTLIHELQKQLLVELYKKYPKTAVSMEMFERDAQTAVDDYLTDKIKEDEFIKNSRPWPDYLVFYKALLELAKTNKAPLIAANVPRKYANIYSTDGMRGINALKPEERKFIARDIQVVEDDYQKNFYQVMLANMGMKEDYKPNPNQENLLYLYYGAQVVKDETMGESIADFIKKNSDYKVIHFNGDFHSDNGLGTPQKVAARLPKAKFCIISPDYIEQGKEIVYNDEWNSKGDFVIALESKPKMQMSQMMMGGHLAENSLKAHNIKIDINPDEKMLKGKDIMTFKSPVIKGASVKILKDFKIKSVVINGKSAKYDIEADSVYQEIFIKPKEEFSEITIEYEGKLYHKPNDRNLNQKHAYSLGMISSEKDEGVYLPGGSFYFGTDNDLADFSVEVTLPKDFKLITSGKEEFNKDEGDKHTYKYLTELACDDLTLIAGKFNIIDSIYDGKRFSVYTINCGSSANAYLTAIIDYYKEYTKLLGPYPYSGFAVVENFFATGFGMPGYTLLSNKLMMMPWITLTPGSLAHEFVHNWWGNGVYVDRNAGNWCEALTTFCSNYYYNVITKKSVDALEWRKKSLLALEALPEKDNYPLSKFKYQSVDADAVIGYNKGGFLFYEVTKAIGDERFFEGLRNFANKYKGKKATWFRLADSFDELVKRDSLKVSVRKIFNQWLMDSKVPTLTLKDVDYKNDTLKFAIAQDMMNYLQVPVRIIREKDTLMKSLTFQGGVARFNEKIDGKVLSLTVDPYYQVLRHLNKWEIPYSFALTLSENPLVILPSKASKEYKVSSDVVNMMKESQYVFDSKSIDDLKDEDWKDRTILALGNRDNNSFIKSLNNLYPDYIGIESDAVTLKGTKQPLKGNVCLINTVHPINPALSNKSMSLILFTDLENQEQFRRLFRYTSYSLVMISATKMGRPIAQYEIFPPERDRSKLEWKAK